MGHLCCGTVMQLLLNAAFKGCSPLVEIQPWLTSTCTTVEKEHWRTE